MTSKQNVIEIACMMDKDAIRPQIPLCKPEVNLYNSFHVIHSISISVLHAPRCDKVKFQLYDNSNVNRFQINSVAFLLLDRGKH